MNETKTAKLIRLRKELEEARSWVLCARDPVWAEDWVSQLEYKISLLDCEPPDELSVKHLKTMKKSYLARLLTWARRGRAAILAIALLCLCNAPAWAAIDDKLAVRAVMGEASGEGYRGMYAVSHAIRNRGHLRGVYGKRAKRIYKESWRVWRKAQAAWRASATGADPTRGATHWENVREFGRPYWAKSMRQTAVIGQHVFYKV